MESSDANERAVTEMTAVATLIGIALLLVVGIGASVFLIAPEDTSEPEAEFSFRYIDQSGVLIVTHEEGDSIPAGDLYVEGDDGNATWAALSGSNASEMVEPNDAAQVSGSNAFGSSVGSNDRISVVWRNATMNGTAVLGEWNDDGSL